MGGGFHFIASYWILFNESESTESVAWLSIAFWAPAVFFMPFSGVVVDRWNRRKLLIISLVNPAIANLVLIGIMLSEVFQPMHLYFYGPVTSLTHALFWNALVAYLQEHLSKEELLHANGINTALFQGGYLAGAGLAGIAFPYIGAVGAFSVDTCGLVVAIAGWMMIRRWFPDRDLLPTKSEHHSFMSDFREGLVAVRQDMPLFGFVLLSLVPRFSAQGLNILQVGFSKVVLKTGSMGFGLLDMAYGVGAMCCGLLFPHFARKLKRDALLAPLALFCLSLSFLGISYTTTLAQTMAAQCITGIAATVVGILANTTLQREADNKVIGRVGSVVQLVQYSTMPLFLWGLGRFAGKEQGTLLHSEPLRDGFVLTSLVALVGAGIGVLVTLVFVRSRRSVEPMVDEPSSPT